MRKIYHSSLKSINWILAGLLTLLGFACSNDDDDGGVAMYGVPWEGYAIKGSVVDKTTGEPIPNIEVKVAFPDSIYKNIPTSYKWRDTTDINGEFELIHTPNRSLDGNSEIVPIALHDINGDANEPFKSDTIPADFEKANHIDPGSGWFEGWMAVRLEGIKLEKKK